MRSGLSGFDGAPSIECETPLVPAGESITESARILERADGCAPFDAIERRAAHARICCLVRWRRDLVTVFRIYLGW